MRQISFYLLFSAENKKHPARDLSSKVDSNRGKESSNSIIDNTMILKMFAHIDMKTAALCLLTVTSVIQVRLGKYRLTNKPIREESAEKASGIRNSSINSCTLGLNATAKIAEFKRIIRTITVRLTRTLLKKYCSSRNGR